MATKEPLLLVGGQAINLWALYYEGVTKDMAPFVSRDVDLLGDRKVLKEIAELAGLKPNYFPLKPPSNEVGYVAPEDATGGLVVIEVLRWVNGVSGDELLKDSVTMGIGQDQVPVRLPSPVYLLKAKLANLASINQKGRQDGRHVMILFRLIPSYFKDLIGSVNARARSERSVVYVLGALLEIVTSEENRRILDMMELEAKTLFGELPTEGFPKIAAFKKHQLKRVFG
ncbi:MAG: hypothetical protein GVY36_10080 [Verrucomicrobia bacterium]|nr:hypothetical protein [Verrucomicrobiota bacterium]